MKIAQYPRDLDSTPLDLEVGVLTDETGNGGARLLDRVYGPDGAPVDAKALILVDPTGNPVDLTGSGNLKSYGTRTEIADINNPAANPVVYLSETNRSGEFVFINANLSAQVAADPNQGVYIAPASAPTGASGAWKRVYHGALNVKWFGVVGDNVTNDGPAFQAALNFINTTAPVAAYGYPGKAGPELRVPMSRYYLGNTALDVRTSMIIEGEGSSGFAATQECVLRWATGQSGIRLQTEATSGETGSGGAFGSSATGTIIRGLTLVGGYTPGAAEAEHHGILMRAAAKIEDCFFSDWHGDGIHIVAAGPSNGNANLWRVNNCTAIRCRTGLFIDGPDVNAGISELFSAIACRCWGIHDTSFLGNTHISPHLSDCGSWVDGAFSMAEQGGLRYGVNAGQEAGASTNAPPATATDNQWWHIIDAGAPGGGVRTWSSGLTWRAGGPFFMDEPGGNAKNVLVGVYTESGQPRAVLDAPSMIIGGQIASSAQGKDRTHPYGGWIEGGTSAGLISKGGFIALKNITALGNAHSLGPQTGAASDSTSSFDNTLNSSTLQMRSFVGGVPQIDGVVSSFRGFGLVLDGYAQMFFRSNGATKVFFNATEFTPQNNNAFALGQAGLRYSAVYAFIGDFTTQVNVNGQKIVGARGAAVADPAALTSVNATNAAAAPTQTEFNNFVAEFNKLRTDLTNTRAQLITALGRLRAAAGHGLIAD